jgi:hypothetical protein
MERKRNRWLLLLLLIPACLLLWFFVGSRRVQPPSPGAAQIPASQPRENQGRSTRLPNLSTLPRYVLMSYAGEREDSHAIEYQLAGIVTSEKGEVLPGAVVSVHNSGPRKPKFSWPNPVASDICDYEGRYTVRLASPMAGAIIRIEKEGFATLEDAQRISLPGTVTKNYMMKPAPACLDGIVSNMEGTPVAGAAITTSVDQLVFGGDLDLSRLSVFGHTDSSGRFRVSGLPEGRIHVGIVAAGYLRGGSTLALKAGPCGHADIQLSAANTIAFHVRDRQGRPIADAIVQSASGSTRADENGFVELVIATETDPFECTISARSYKTKTLALDPKVPPKTVVLDYGDLFTGRVLSESGKPIAGAQVIVFGSRQGIGSPAKGSMPAPIISSVENTLETDADGRFSLTLSDPPVTAVWVTKRGYVEKRQYIEAARAREEVEIRLPFANGGLFGRVTDSEGSPIHQFSVVLKDEAAQESRAYSRSFKNEDGYFSVTDVAPGSYQLFIMRDLPGSRILRLGQVEIRRGYSFGEIAAQFPPAIEKIP